jgi:DNA-binding transcriptional ArsR family regulator
VCSFTVAIEPVLDELPENDVDMRTISHHVKYLFERGVMRCILFVGRVSFLDCWTVLTSDWKVLTTW